jgi:hypothetical protein
VDVSFHMIDFAIHPPICILGREGVFVRSTAEAAAFVRQRMLRQPDGSAARVLGRLENVNSARDAQHAAKAFRAWVATGMTPIDLPDRKLQLAGKRQPRAQ